MELKVGINKERIPEVLKWGKHFVNLMAEWYFTKYIKANTDFDLSIFLHDDNDKIVGAYLLGKNQIDNYIEDPSDFKGLKGIEGVLLYIDEEYRGLGWGSKMKDYPKQLDVDYVWGQQHESLNNLNDWLKRRKLFGHINECYITAEIY